ncbi:MAG: cytochrome-c oxidase, cbb3-type subunit I [Alphaproteobacteria bacterium]|nr:cytochrome-c oxidase, cbb3-type subunit I [Alphaproteobacteria bacterium]
MRRSVQPLSRGPLMHILSVLLLALGAVATLSLALQASDGVMSFHAGLMGLFFIAGIALLHRRRRNWAGGEGYEDGIIRAGAIASTFWGVVGFSVGLVIALQLAFPVLNFDLPWTNFGRLRPLHTSAVVFAFGGNVLMMTSFHVVQRTCQARLAGGWAPWFVFWGYQLFIVMAATGYVLGVTQSKEYAEPEWYVDLWLTLVWVVYLLVFLGTLWKRREPHIYVANWFYLAFIVTVAMLHIINNLAVPVSWTGTRSYVVWAGVQDALTQWWYGHNAVGFFLTAGFLAIMYYYVPKRAERPIYSYRLSIVHFWSLIFLYIWAGPHHLHYTALPEWSQTLGMTFSIMLWMPSWGGMVNGLMTLSGAWDKLRTDPVLRMMVVSLAFYGMSTFEGPLMAIKEVNALSHYTDWTIGHVHSGALGWVAFVSFGALYHVVPIMWGRQRLYSMVLVNAHFWIATLGIVLYITAMWVSGILQGLMWRAYDHLGFLEYSFVETVAAMHPFYVIRALGGLLFVIGSLIMAYNLWRTMRGDLRIEAAPAGTTAATVAVGAAS